MQWLHTHVEASPTDAFAVDNASGITLPLPDPTMNKVHA